MTGEHSRRKLGDSEGRKDEDMIHALDFPYIREPPQVVYLIPSPLLFFP